MRIGQGDTSDVPVVTAEVRWKPGAQASREAIGAAWDAVAQTVAAVDVSLRSLSQSVRAVLEAVGRARR